MKLRRARSLQVSWRENRLTFENYLTHKIAYAAPLTVLLLDFFSDWHTAADAIRAWPDYSAASIRRTLAQLVAQTLLVAEKSPQARADAALADAWRAWLPEASFHFSTKDTHFASPKKWDAIVKGFLAASPQPPVFKSYPAAGRRALPLAAITPDAFSEALLTRHTHREFSGEAVSLNSINTLLWLTWGAMGHLHSPRFGRLLHKTSPSGGARHPGEVYVAAFDVDGLAPGIYHYDVKHHALNRIRRGQFRARVLSDANDQKHVGRASAVFIMTSLFSRSSWKYRTPRAYRVVTLDQGHLGQTFCLVATWLGLAPFTTAAFRDASLEALVKIDGIQESAMYLAGVGMPVKTRATSASVAPRRPRAGRGHQSSRR